MIRVYLLPVITISGTEQVSCIHLIHDALLDCTHDPIIRYLLMDTTDEEHTILAVASEAHRAATQQELDRYQQYITITPPDPDRLRAQELLSSSPDVITQPEMWELIRIFGKLLGLTF